MNKPQAPDEHWLLVKKHWIPIEHLLKQLAPTSEDSLDAINQLNDKLGNRTVNMLHVLRKERNALLHNNVALPDAFKWEQNAITAMQALNDIDRKKDPYSTMNMLKQIFLYWLFTSPVSVGLWLGTNQHLIEKSVSGIPMYLLATAITAPLLVVLTMIFWYILLLIFEYTMPLLNKLFSKRK